MAGTARAIWRSLGTCTCSLKDNTHLQVVMLWEIGIGRQGGKRKRGSSIAIPRMSASSWMRGILGLCLVLVFLCWSGEAQAGQLADRLAQFPNWTSKPPITSDEGDLVYPKWMEGTWKVTSTLVEQVAPLAPDVVTPGFVEYRTPTHLGCDGAS